MSLKSWLSLALSLAFLACGQMSTASAGVDVSYLMRIGYTQLAEGKPLQAVETFTRALQYDPTNIDGRRYLAYALLKAGKAAEAIPQFEYVLRAQSQSSLDQTSLGDAYFYTNNYKQAIECYKKAISVDAHFALAYRGLTHAYAAGNENNLAEQTCTQGMQNVSDRDTRDDLQDLYTKLTTKIEPSKLQE